MWLDFWGGSGVWSIAGTGRTVVRAGKFVFCCVAGSRDWQGIEVG